MMTLNLDEIRRFLGRPLQDPYGRAYGRVVGISANLKDQVTAIGVEVGNGEFVQCPGERLTVQGENLVMVPAWKQEAEEFRKEFEVVTKRLRALDELFSVGDIQRDVYEDLRKQHEDAIIELKGRRTEILETLTQRTGILSTQLRQLQTHLAGNKMLHASGEFDDTSYKAASEAIDTGLIRAMAEKKEVESISSYFGKLDAPTQPYQAPAPTPAPAPVQTQSTQSSGQTLVLHVRET
jgi:CdvA-like coiled-coil domain